ncbi:EAL domain-containing protein [Sphingomonas quercus]|uniref:EAL domain-containing protein n=1 Tax=Sphingomonas quercus TaxID=2842451 RepID=A0ABS6BMH3_9SPHN|nr:EAL domain-containing protein [Sphingomonas quercus]MBU3079529.1 EAL domain-containing protein [Sphingomonas quercus]
MGSHKNNQLAERGREASDVIVDSSDRRANFLIDATPSEVSRYSRAGHDLVLEMERGDSVWIKGFFAHGVDFNRLAFVHDGRLRCIEFPDAGGDGAGLPVALDAQESVASRLNGPAGAAGASTPTGYTIRIQFRINNHAALLRAFGDRIMGEVDQALRRRVGAHMHDIARLDLGPFRERQDGIDLDIALPRRMPADLGLQLCLLGLSNMCATMPFIPFATTAGPVHLSLSAECRRPDGGLVGTVDGFLAAEPITGNGRRDRVYREDMAAASQLLCALRPKAGEGDEGFALCWQPVRSADNRDSILYHEGLARVMGANGEARSQGSAIASLERIGLIGAYDHLIIRLVLRELEHSPEAVLGVNVSASTLRRDSWWEAHIAYLERDRPLAERLIIEVTETAVPETVSEMFDLLARLRRCGVRIALDDFGTGFASIWQLNAMAPDIVKIDQVFMRRAAVCEHDRAVFRQVVKLAQLIVPTVVVEGIESGAEASLAREAGIIWQQGFYWGHPSFLRPWRVGFHDDVDQPHDDRTFPG